MKSILCVMTSVGLSLASFCCRAQCNEATTKTISYDTTVNGYGNTMHNFIFPKFNTAMGTLLEVDISPEITLNYSFQLENKELIAIPTYRVKAFREDEISSTSLLAPLSYSYQKTFGPYLLLAADGLLGSGLDFIFQPPTYVMNHVKPGFTVYNVVDFIGSGSVQFNYVTTTSSAVLGSINNLFNGAAVDTINFKVTYKYCPQISLPADITSFTARKTNAGSVEIKWIAQNETNTRKYELQKSNDGKNFTGLAQFTPQSGSTSAGSYSSQYRIQSSDKRKVIFRIKQTDTDGTVKYSQVRIVDVDNPNQENDLLALYPNPVKNAAVTLLFSNQNRGNWQVGVYDINGNLVQQHQFNNALAGKINSDATLKKGVYLVKAINTGTQEQLLNKLVVQ
ncbi:MAG: choice-of-anchor E domain-containing protein [Chitinophagaceae bacterium]